MSEIRAASEPDLRAFLETAGRSLADAQGTLAGDALPSRSTALAISDAELEVKAAVAQTATGALALQTVDIAQAQKGGIDAALLSTVRIRYVAVAGETAVVPPKRNIAEVKGAVLKQRDVANLDRILGGLKVEAAFLPDQRRWLVTAHDPQGRVVREIVVPDDVEEKTRG